MAQAVDDGGLPPPQYGPTGAELAAAQGRIANRAMRASHLIHQKVAANAKGKITLYERPVPAAAAVEAQHLYLVITTNTGQTIQIEAGPSNQAAMLNTGLGSDVVLQQYLGDNGTNISNAGVAVTVPSGESFSQFANELIGGANYFDMNNTNLYGVATSNSNSFMSGLLDWAGASSALTQMNGYNMVPVGPNTYNIPGEDQPFAPSEYGPGGVTP